MSYIHICAYTTYMYIRHTCRIYIYVHNCRHLCTYMRHVYTYTTYMSYVHICAYTIYMYIRIRHTCRIYIYVHNCRHLCRVVVYTCRIYTYVPNYTMCRVHRHICEFNTTLPFQHQPSKDLVVYMRRLLLNLHMCLCIQNICGHVYICTYITCVHVYICIHVHIY